MTRTMQDSVTASALIPGANFYAGYVDGHYANVAAIRARFPRTRVIRITVLGSTLDADVVDIETGDCTPHSGAAWAKRKHDRGDHPTLYCNTSTRPAVEHECSLLGLALHRDYEIWEAHYDNVATLPVGAVAKQYRDHGPHGENVDMSVVADYWPGVDSPVPHFAYTRILHLGSVGRDVISLKRRLRYLGYRRTAVTPYFGRGLDADVRQFQHDHRLTVDGLVGPLTAKAIG